MEDSKDDSKKNSKDDIYQELLTVMDELFELEPKDIVLSARLHEDLGIDSIDTIDLMIALNRYIGRKIKPEEFQHVRSIGDIVDTVYALKHS